ncbi:replication protein A 70 kDa DNA-binding subunit B-like [Silene latifolia]|uniref:replication protein A 70 kDa DNA-binding subunit B-like n=1 Tax=Silene latifolia TaxID=37657 RepID=UPI003D77D67E
MRPRRKHIREISGSTGPYTIRARVIEKTNVHSEPDGQGLELQIITFKDEEGTKMQTFLHNDDLEIFEDMIHDDMEYDISNATIQLVVDTPSEGPAEQMYDLYFNINTIVQPVSDAKVPATSNYILIGSIPRKVTLEDRYDVLGVVIYIDRCCHTTANEGQTSDVCEVMIVDQSHEQIMIVTAWSDMPLKECWSLQSIAYKFPVVAFTALMPSYQKGFSLSTTHSTYVVLDPPGKEADTLRTWATQNKTLLQAKRQHVFEVRLPEITRAITTIESLLDKGINNTLQEEHHWLHVLLHQFDPKDVHLYLGCSNCGTGNAEEIGVAYMCNACLQEDVISTPRMVATFEVADETGVYTLSAYTENMERLLELKAHILYCMTPQEKQAYLVCTATRLRVTKLYVQVVPTAALSRIQELKWMLTEISLI